MVCSKTATFEVIINIQQWVVRDDIFTTKKRNSSISAFRFVNLYTPINLSYVQKKIIKLKHFVCKILKILVHKPESRILKYFLGTYRIWTHFVLVYLDFKTLSIISITQNQFWSKKCHEPIDPSKLS